MSDPIAYLITWSTYGTWLHGDERGSVNHAHNTYGTAPLPPLRGLALHSARTMSDKAFVLDDNHRRRIMQSVIDTCRIKGWYLHALHIRTSHIHAIVAADIEPQKILRQLKSWATRSVMDSGMVRQKRVWAEGGSTRYIWSLNQLNRAMNYVLHRQGEPMAVYPPVQNPDA